MKNITSKFHVHPTRSRNHSLPGIFTFLLGIPSSRASRYFLQQLEFFQRIENGSIFIPRVDGIQMDPTGMERYDRERLRVLIEFPTLPDSNSTFISRFARESDPAEVRVSLISRLPPVEQQSISYRDRIIEKREDSCCHSPVPKLNSRSRRFISSRAPACRQLQLPNFIFHVFGHRETRVVKSTR